jgi:hypothetical protein
MPRDIAPLTNALEESTPGMQHDVYPLLPVWDKSIEATLERGGGSRFREVMKQYLPQVIDLVDTVATNEEIDWASSKSVSMRIHQVSATTIARRCLPTSLPGV